MPRYLHSIAGLVVLSVALLMGCGPGSAAKRADEVPAAAPGATPGGATGGVVKVADPSALVATAREAIEEGRLDQAESALLEATSLQPADAEAQRLLGVALFRRGEIGRAVEPLERASHAEGPEGFAALDLLIRLRVRQGDYAAAEDLLTDRIDAQPDDMRLAALRLWVWLGEGKAREVIDRSRALLRKDETNVLVMLQLAKAYLQLRQTELADYVLRVASGTKDTAAIRLGLAEVAIAKGDRKAALFHLERAVKLEPDAPEVLNDLGVVYHWAGDDEGAVGVLSRAVQLAPAFAKAYVNLGNAYRRQRKFQEAADAYRRALDIAPELAAAHFDLGILYFEQDDGAVTDDRRFHQALESFNRYKTLMGADLPKGDPVDGYIAEALVMLKEIERSRAEEAAPVDDEGGEGGSDGVETEPAPDEAPGDASTDDLDDGSVSPDDAPEPSADRGGTGDSP